MFKTLICNKKFCSGKVFTKQVKFAKTVSFNGYFYEFNSGEFYPLELAISQISAFNKFDLIFIEDIYENGWVGVFIKTAMRKTIFIETSYFESQLLRYSLSLNSIGILNEKSDLLFPLIEDNLNIERVKIDKLPTLIDPAKRAVILRRYFFVSSIFIITSLIYSYLLNEIKTKLEEDKAVLEATTKEFRELNDKVKLQILPNAPSKESQSKNLTTIFQLLDNGELK